MNITRTCLLLVFTLIISITSINCFAQQNTKRYYAKLALTDGRKVTGILHSVDDSSIRLLQRDETIVIPVSDILFIKIRSKSSVRNGVLGGLVTGAIVGGVIGYKLNDESSGIGSLVGLILGASAGAGAGTLTGLIIAKNYKRKMIIDGKLENFEKYKEKLQSYQIGPRN